MKRLKALCLIICLFGLVSACAGSSAQTPSASDSNQERVIQVRKTITVAKGKTFDGMGALYDWTGAGDCSQTEGMPPMFKLSHGATSVSYTHLPSPRDLSTSRMPSSA